MTSFKFMAARLFTAMFPTMPIFPLSYIRPFTMIGPEGPNGPFRRLATRRALDV